MVACNWVPLQHALLRPFLHKPGDFSGNVNSISFSICAALVFYTVVLINPAPNGNDAKCSIRSGTLSIIFKI